MSDVHDSTCCAVAAAELLRTKWTSLIVHDLSEGARRFTQLARACPGISPRTLSERLHTLEEQGVILRRTFPESPPRVEYELTEKDVALLPILDAMRRFGRTWLLADDGLGHPSHYLAARVEPPLPVSVC
jgi:DNA-binding HxlR family transcriptional regulator